MRIHFFILNVLAGMFGSVVALTSCQHTYRVTNIDGELLTVDSTWDSFASAGVAKALASYKQEVDSMMNHVVCEAEVDMDRSRPEGALSNLIADVLRQSATSVLGHPADVGLINIGGIRSSLAKGKITVGDIFEILPFENSLCVISVKGEVLQQVLKEIALKGGEGLSGVQMQIDAKGNLLRATVQGQPINPAKNYKISTIDYLAEGNDGLPSLVHHDERVCPPGATLRSLFLAYAQRCAAQGKKLSSKIEGRVMKEQKLEMGMGNSGEIQLTLLHTSDTHSRLEPISPVAADREAGRGGAVRRAALVDSMRKQDADLLLLDCGDISQGTPYYNLFRGEAEIMMMNQMGYDAMTIGNHEFDFGLENMARLFRMARFPVVCSNYGVQGTVLQGLVKPYVVLERKGVRIGIFGLSPRMEGLVQETKCEGIVFRDPVEAARETVETLRQTEHCDVVICLSHLGKLGIDSKEVGDERLMAATHGIDLVLGGHTHSLTEHPEAYLNDCGEKVMLQHSGSRGTHVGKIVMTIE